MITMLIHNIRSQEYKLEQILQIKNYLKTFRILIPQYKIGNVVIEKMYIGAFQLGI